MAPPADDIVVSLPPNAPRVPPNAFTRWLGRTVLRLGGWRMDGAFPDIPKVVMIAAPHSSNWDGLWGFAVKLAMGLDVKVLGKDTLLRIPLLGPVLRRMGVIPINRRAAQGVAGERATDVPGAAQLWAGGGAGGHARPGV